MQATEVRKYEWNDPGNSVEKPKRARLWERTWPFGKRQLECVATRKSQQY